MAERAACCQRSGALVQSASPASRDGAGGGDPECVPSELRQSLDAADMWIRLCQIDRHDLVQVFIQEGGFTYVWQEDGSVIMGGCLMRLFRSSRRMATHRPGRGE